MSEDPYQPPRSDDDAPVLSRHALVEVVRGWEKLRIAYNLILLLPGLGIAALWMSRQQLPPIFVVVQVILVTIAANLAFLLGPAAEVYFRAIFRKGETIGFGRFLIFGAGLVVSAGVFLVVLLLGMA